VFRGGRVSEVGEGSLVCVCPRVQSHRLPHQIDVQAGKNWTIANWAIPGRRVHWIMSAPTLGRHRRAINCPHFHRGLVVRHRLHHLHQLSVLFRDDGSSILSRDCSYNGRPIMETNPNQFTQSTFLGADGHVSLMGRFDGKNLSGQQYQPLVGQFQARCASWSNSANSKTCHTTSMVIRIAHEGVGGQAAYCCTVLSYGVYRVQHTCSFEGVERRAHDTKWLVIIDHGRDMIVTHTVIFSAYLIPRQA
jgi:hypothetical protein